ncbi:MAG: ABC transporter substrate-binding protein [Anaerolineales bacterium]|nr:ABC transporter substrate-binding protein [Anaerolineales bacterium]
MIKKLFLLLAVALFALSACTATATEEPATQNQPAEQPAQDAAEQTEPAAAPVAENPVMTFTDDLGNTIELTAYPQAIVSLSPSTTEILFAVGAGEQVVGREEFSLYPEEAVAVPSVGSMWGGLPSEAILALEPDLVVVAEIITPEQVQALQDLGLQVYWQANPDDFAGLFANLRVMAELTGHQAKAEALVSGLEARVNAVQEKIAPLSYAPIAFYELDATDPANPWTAGSGTFIDYILNMAGGINAASELQGDYIQISTEALITANPDIILLADALYGVSPESVAERPGWDVIAAVQNGAIYPIDPNILSVPGPRLVDALEAVAIILHPEVFE